MVQEIAPLAPMMEVPEDTPPTPMMEVPEGTPLAPVAPGDDHLISMVPPPSILVDSFDWSRFTGYHLPSYVPFEITVQAFNMVIPSTIIDEGPSFSVISSTTWKAFGSPQLVPIM